MPSLLAFFVLSSTLQDATAQWRRYTHQGTGFSIDIPKSMKVDQWEPGPHTGSPGPHVMIVGISFSDAERFFTITADKVLSPEERADFLKRAPTMDTFVETQLKAGKAIYWTTSKPDNRIGFSFIRTVEYQKTRAEWAWSIWAPVPPQGFESTSQFLRRVADSFSWQYKDH